MSQIPESDWKIFRKLREPALERFCKRVLDELESHRADTSKSYHARYLEIYRLLQDRDDELAHGFNDARRSTMLIQLSVIYGYGLLEPGELELFSPGTQATVELLAKGTSF